MPSPNPDSAKRAKQTRTPDIQPEEGTREGTKDGQRETAAKPDKERSDWEGMAPKPEQGEDDVAAPGQLPETD